MEPGDGRFPSTRWSLVVAAAHQGTPDGREALASLCSAYWYPLYAFVRRSGQDPASSEDLTQAYFTRLLFMRVRRPAAGVDACPTTAPASQRDTPPAGPSRSGRPAGSAARTARCASSPWDPAPPYPPSFRTRRPADEPLRNGPFLFPTWFPGPSDLLSFPFSFPPQVVGPPTADGNRFGAVTCAARIRDKMNRTTIMVQFTPIGRASCRERV